MSGLKAWCNGYEVVAASSEEEARSILSALGWYEPEDVDGEGWKTLGDARKMRGEDGEELAQTVGDVVRESAEPRHLWSCEP